MERTYVWLLTGRYNLALTRWIWLGVILVMAVCMLAVHILSVRLSSLPSRLLGENYFARAPADIRTRSSFSLPLYDLGTSYLQISWYLQTNIQLEVNCARSISHSSHINVKLHNDNTGCIKKNTFGGKFCLYLWINELTTRIAYCVVGLGEYPQKLFRFGGVCKSLLMQSKPKPLRLHNC